MYEVARLDYLITTDLVETLAFRHGISDILQNADLMAAISRLEEDFISDFARMIPEDKRIRAIRVREVVEEVELSVEKAMSAFPEAVTVSLDPVFRGRGDSRFSLQTTRALNNETGECSIKNRSGTPSLDEQLTKLQDRFQLRDASKKGIILVDIGTFSGGTITDLVMWLEKNRIPVMSVVLGISSNDTKQKLDTKFGSRIDLQIARTFDLFEWIELRDLFVLDGRSVIDGLHKDGTRRFIPYTEDLQSWASIPVEKDAACRELCFRYRDALYTTLKEFSMKSSIPVELVPLNKAMVPVKV